MKKKILESKKTNKDLAKELNLSQEHIGKIKNNKIWKDINLNIKAIKKPYKTSKYSFDKMVELKKIIIDNINLKHDDVVKLTSLSIKTISKVKRNLLWEEIPYNKDR